MNKFLILCIAIAAACACSRPTFTQGETALIGSGDIAEAMRVLTIDDPDDLTVLRAKASELTRDDVRSELFSQLKARMLLTVNDTARPGVGIAAPQVGIGKKLIAVQRFDKAGKPFEFYVNPSFMPWDSGRAWSREGCLSIPSGIDSVKRYKAVLVTYTDERTFLPRLDTVRGFTAIIFQHEIDHLDGILFTDPHE
ncbi:MAG: peptide deformylase [Rikenellaceae bacterium]|nr:peptide deformylase [Rikenellaceae bacterium]